MERCTNYTVRWFLADGKPHNNYWFSSLEEAQAFAALLQARDDIDQVSILRAGRNPATPRWGGTRRPPPKKRTEKATGLIINPEVWIEPEGYVDTEADKHGPPVYIAPAPDAVIRSAEEKVDWYWSVRRIFNDHGSTSIWH